LATQAKRDYYEIIGVSRTASDQEIRSAFEKWAFEFHARGKPKNIDEVEEIRGLVTAYPRAIGFGQPSPL
jgi:molecular chaperone DnaJ